MINSSNSYEKASARLARRKADNELIADKRQKDVYLSFPEIKEIDSKLRSLIGKTIQAALDKNSLGLIAEIKRESEALCNRKAQILNEAGLGEAYLDGVFSCTECKDTGYLQNGKTCTCLKILIEEEKAKSLKESGIDLSAESFDSFRLDYYPPEDRAVMDDILTLCKRYSAGFSRSSRNLILRGGTGTGKTFLASCIASSISKSGFDTMFVTVSELIALNSKKNFWQDADAAVYATTKIDDILSSEFLVLDGLGNEVITNMTQGVVFEVIDTRITKGLPTLITTLYSDAETAAKYSPQLMSRLRGEYLELKLRGNDIRLLKKGQG